MNYELEPIILDHTIKEMLTRAWNKPPGGCEELLYYSSLLFLLYVSFMYFDPIHFLSICIYPLPLKNKIQEKKKKENKMKKKTEIGKIF